MSKPVASQIAFLGSTVLYRPMSSSEYNMYINGEPVDENTLFTAYNIPKGFEISNIVISIDGDIRINVVHK